MALHSGDTSLNAQYRILKLLGRGGSGFVYHAQDTHLGEEVAVRELTPGLVGDEEILKRFLAEAKATLRLTHARIARTFRVRTRPGEWGRL
jgi:serine/threonine-protein kinase